MQFPPLRSHHQRPRTRGGERGSGGGGVVKRERSPPSPPFSRNGLTAVGVATGDGRRDTLHSKNVWEDVMLSSVFDLSLHGKVQRNFTVSS